MKKVIPLVLCVFLFLVSTKVDIVFAQHDEVLNFTYNGKIYTYSLIENIPKSNIFSTDYEINKYSRFSGFEKRKQLLNKMLSIGIEKKVALNYLFPNLNKKINSISKSINIKEKNAELKINSQTEKVFHIKKEIVGICVDKQKLIDNICSKYLNNENLTFKIPTKQLLPEIKYEDLAKNTNLRADFSTDISSSTIDRKHNIKNALNSLNKVEIYPNQTFSFNNTVGRRTAENGYREAKIIVNNEFVDGLGGGVCQVSSTLYNSALRAGLEIIEANKHSKVVGYVNLGFDAMVNFGSSDLKFKNNTNEKITIITNFSPSKARIRIFGEDLNKTTYKLYNKIEKTIAPTEEVLIDEKGEYLDKVKFSDESFYLKKPSKGIEVKTYREKYVDNALISTELLRYDKYPVVNGVKIYGNQNRENENFEFNVNHSQVV